MSTTTERMPLEVAWMVARRMVKTLQPYCERIEVAGSIRRGEDTIGDVELVVVPLMRAQQPRLLDGVADGAGVDCLHEALNEALHRGTVRKRPLPNGRARWGEGQKLMLWPIPDVGRVPVDLFRALPSTFGAVLAIRTGPAEFSHKLVTARGQGGWRPNAMEFDDGAVWRYEGLHRHFVPTPDEATLFRELGLPYVEPADRTATTYDRLRVRVHG